ncbi:DegV family protein, partial [Lacticaseibacillus rhamnosus]
MYQLLTDSCCDLPYQTLHDHQVEFVSMHFTVNGTDYEDDLGEDHYDINAFYEQLKQNVMPTTTQVNVGQFVDFFTPYVKANTPILYVGFSSGLSGTFNSATQARAMLLEKFQMRRFTG